jgi:hypothetical protein
MPMYGITNNGLKITLPFIMIGQDRVIALLDCETYAEETVGNMTRTHD